MNLLLAVSGGPGVDAGLRGASAVSRMRRFPGARALQSSTLRVSENTAAFMGCHFDVADGRRPRGVAGGSFVCRRRACHRVPSAVVGGCALRARAVAWPGMELVEIKQRERIQREQAAARLRELADQLSRHNDVEFERDGITFKMRVPDEIELKIELEIGDDGSELEIELTW